MQHESSNESNITQFLLGIYYVGYKNGLPRCNNKLLDLLSKIAIAYETDFSYQVLCDLWMNKWIWVKRLNLVHVKTKPTV